MIEQAAILSLQIFGIRIVFLEGMILGWLRSWVATRLDRLLGFTWSRYFQKPLWDCFPCMSGIWTIILTWSIDVKLILMVCAINFIIDLIIPPYEDKHLDK